MSRSLSHAIHGGLLVLYGTTSFLGQGGLHALDGHDHGIGGHAERPSSAGGAAHVHQSCQHRHHGHGHTHPRHEPHAPAAPHHHEDDCPVCHYFATPALIVAIAGPVGPAGVVSAAAVLPAPLLSSEDGFSLPIRGPPEIRC